MAGVDQAWRPTKGDVVIEIAAMLGVPAPHMSTGSTEPREIFELVDRTLGLGFGRARTKPELAQCIVTASGQPWLADYESRGGTVTLRGLLAVRDAVAFFTRV